MKQEDKELLLRDLCARLPYGVIVEDRNGVHRLTSGNTEFVDLFNGKCNIKPYLFPLSSMTEEQKKEISKRYNYHNPYQLCIEITNHSEGYWDDDTSCHLQDYLWLEDWFDKNHFDYRGAYPYGVGQ